MSISSHEQGAGKPPLCCLGQQSDQFYSCKFSTPLHSTQCNTIQYKYKYEYKYKYKYRPVLFMQIFHTTTFLTISMHCFATFQCLVSLHSTTAHNISMHCFITFHYIPLHCTSQQFVYWPFTVLQRKLLSVTLRCKCTENCTVYIVQRAFLL